MKIALVHDFLTQLGGAERVLEELHGIFPQAPVFTLIYDKKKTQGKFETYDIRVSFLQKFYRVLKKYKLLLPLMPLAIQSFDFSGYDLIFSDSSAFAKGVMVPKNAIHFCYCHTPTRYLWQDMDSYVESQKINFLMKKILKVYLKNYLRDWDYQAAQKVNYFIANSKEVRKRIEKYYKRDSIVVYPPVDTNRFFAGEKKQDYYLVAGRLEPYKRVDLAIAAFQKNGLNLKVAGSGSELPRLNTQNHSSKVEFLGRVNDDELRTLYQKAKGFVFCALEDAGITILEAMACGTPVIAFGRGGAVEFIEPGKHGELFEEQTSESLIDAISRVQNSHYRTHELTERAEKFNKENFRSRLSEFINEKLNV